MAEDTQDTVDELPELEGVALEPAAPSLGSELSLDGAFDIPPQAPAPTPVIAAPTPEPPKVAAPAPSTISSKELTDDILGGVDFDLPAAPAAAPIAPKPMVAKAPAAPPAFKPPAALFGQSGGFGASGLKPAAPLATKPAPTPVAAPVVAAPITAAPSLDLGAELAGDAKEALRAALTSDTAPASLPPEITRALFMLARALIKKGIVTVDELV